MRISDRRDRGSALLAVLWLSAALAAIAFSLANTVRSETDRAATAIDGLRSYYLAAGGVDRAALELLWSVTNPSQRPLPPGVITVNYDFPSGVVRVEILTEAGKLDINSAPPEDLFRAMVALGIDPARAREIALAVADWRRPAPSGGMTEFDQYYLSFTPSFRARHASFEEIEELLLVKGVTPEIFYGTYAPSAADSDGPRLVRQGGLVDCVSVYGSKDRIDANTANPAVLAAVGVPPEVIRVLVARRELAPFTAESLNQFLQSVGVPLNRLRVGGNSIVTMKATARIRLQNGQLSDLKRTVAAQFKYMPTGTSAPIHFLRWYDTAWSE